MPRLSEPMRAALTQHGRLIVPIGPWGHDGGTVSALDRNGWLRWCEGWSLPRGWVITPEGRAAIGQGEGGTDV